MFLNSKHPPKIEISKYLTALYENQKNLLLLKHSFKKNKND